MPRSHLLGLLLAFGLLAAFYSLSTPLFEAPDEPWHYAYVRWLAEGHGLPRFDDAASGAGQEVAQPPLYYAVAALISLPVADDDLSELFWHNPQFGYQAGGTVNDNKNMLIHTDRERFPWRGAVLAVRLARLASWLFGLLTVGATLGLAREALPERPAWALVAASVVAFTPQFLFISGVVSNDSAAAATCTCTLWALARIVRQGLTARRLTVAGLALSLALLSKTSALLLVPMALLVVCRSVRPRQCHWRAAALLLALPAALGGWWYLRNWIVFNDPLGLNVHVDTPWGRSAPAGLLDLLGELPQVWRSFWGSFGWGHVEMYGSVYVALGVLVGLALLGWVLHLFQRAEPTHSVTAKILLLAAVWCLAVLAALLSWMRQVEAPHGRLLFPALGAWGLLLAVGWSGLTASRLRFVALLPKFSSSGAAGRVIGNYVARHAWCVPVAGLCLLSLAVPFVFIRPAFTQPRLLSPEKATQSVTPQTVVYDDQVRLLGYRVNPDSVAAGGRVEVTLCWEALRSMDRDYTLFVHLLGQDNLRVAERTSYPGQGRFPTTLWPVGHAFCDAYALNVEPWAPAPELYALEVGLYDSATGWRLPARDASARPLEPPTIGLVRVFSTAPQLRPQHALTYELGGQIALVGYDGPAELDEPGSALLGSNATVTLTLYWEALQAPQGDYKVFVHLLDETGTLVAQDDTFPRDGRYPTWAWQPGDLVPDPHELTLPEARPPGPYHCLVGMYQPDTRERLAVTGPKGVLPDGAIPLMIKPD